MPIKGIFFTHYEMDLILQFQVYEDKTKPAMWYMHCYGWQQQFKITDLHMKHYFISTF